MKIYTYANPFTMYEETFWNEIKFLPHFCVSQTLVQGLCRHYGRQTFLYICTADRIINEVYPEWYQDVELKIEQYLSVSRQIEKAQDIKLGKALKFNQQSLVDALRFVITLGLDASDFNEIGLPKEQIAFLRIWRNVHGEPCWQFDNEPKNYKDRLVAAIKHLHSLEMQETLSEIIAVNSLSVPNDAELSDQVFTCLEFLSEKTDDVSVRQRKILEHYTALSINPQMGFEKIVFHGIHQFTPKILAAIKALEQVGIEVIFLFNYQEEYAHVYDTWKKVYEWTACEFPVTTSSKDFECRLIGEYIGNLLEGRRAGDVRHESIVLGFANRTEFSDYVATYFLEAVSKSKVITLALSNMDEQFYGVRSDSINEILKFYFPEQFGDRHFLSYPIGQFILSLYSMWDEKEGLRVKDALIRECLAVNIWNFHGTSTPISIYERIKGYISDVSEINEVLERLKYLRGSIARIASEESNSIYHEFPFFFLSEYDVGYFIDILKDIQNIAYELFVSEPGQHINFRSHFKKLIHIIGLKMNGNKYITDEERRLVKEVQTRLSTLKSSRSIVGNIEDLKQTIHYYLQNEVEDNSAHWIVRNFEQIDGGVLLSPYTKAKTYHFALLSDRNMKQANDGFFPWPLSVELLDAQGDMSQDSKTILTSYREYPNFLRYSVFYGTYFLDTRKAIQFSYVEESEAEKDIPYYILSLLGLEVKKTEYDSSVLTSRIVKKQPILNTDKLPEYIEAIEQPAQEVFSSCPYRFLLNFVLEEHAYYQEEFDSRRLYSLLLFSETWRKNVGIPKAQIREKMLNESNHLKLYFPFWKTVNYMDMENTAFYYLNNPGMIQKGRLQEYQPDYVRRKMTFKDSRRAVCMRIPYTPDVITSYLHNASKREPLLPPPEDVAVLCHACNQRNVCMQKYLMEEA